DRPSRTARSRATLRLPGSSEERIDRSNHHHQRSDDQLAGGAEQPPDQSALADVKSLLPTAPLPEFADPRTGECSHRSASQRPQDGPEQRDRKTDQRTAYAASQRADNRQNHPTAAATPLACPSGSGGELDE